MGVTHANEVYQKKLQKAPTSAVISCTKIVKRGQWKENQKHKVKDDVCHYRFPKSPILGQIHNLQMKHFV